ncbi:TetR/AcrR family transcriptional regulator [uncultured Neptuniibacter sp.]|uniref:TetR/AcrR family transcriptional regulator n=1 Tax=uncultured Neptuniibacter sp. TaxID=502143 RepID=UPI0026034B67|nr:TetR/AcrR family transcriptional regulator [uncultured Neptuniibacter sp.]
MATTRDLLVDTMKQLLWERGYDATSPNHVLERSGVGKGSFYHHFKSKKDLAIAAMESRADELIAEFEQIIRSTEGDWLDKVSAYLLLPRDALKGCRMGRIVQDPSVEDPALIAPLQRYFVAIHQGLSALYAKAQAEGKLQPECSPDGLATATVSVIQGSFVYGRAVVQAGVVTAACETFIGLLAVQRLN